MQQTINDIFNWAESGLVYLGKVTGLGYMGVNYLLFIVIMISNLKFIDSLLIKTIWEVEHHRRRSLIIRLVLRYGIIVS